jgi:phage terminase Nu1 subunit (DNA packaging protein)
MANEKPSDLELVDTNQLSRLLKIGKPRIQQLIAEGLPVHKRGKPNLFSVYDVMQWKTERARSEHLKTKGGRPRSKPLEPDTDTKSDKPDPRNRLREIDVELKEFELAKAKREWVRIDEVMQLAAEQFADARVTLLNVAGECGRKYGKQIEAFVREKILEAMRKITIDQTPYIAKEEE